MSAGLEGVIAAQTSLSWIDGKRGMLIFRGYAIDDLAQNASFEEVVHLLLEGRLPDEAELAAVSKRLGDKAALPGFVVDALRTLPADTIPMEALRTGVSLLGSGKPAYDGEDLDGSRDQAYSLIAQIPSVIGAFEQIRSGNDPIEPDPGASVAANLLRGLLGEAPDDESAAAMDCALVLHAEHTLNASTFAARVTAGTMSDITSAVVSAIGTLRGPLHGGANEQVAKTLESIPSVDDVERVIDDKLERKERIMGFGHRVYETEDPRGPHLREWARKMAQRHDMQDVFEKAIKVQEIVLDRKGLYINVDFFSAPLYTAMGIPRDTFTPIFAASRSAGWTAHVLEQQDNNRLIRPTSEYIGERHLDWIPLEQR